MNFKVEHKWVEIDHFNTLCFPVPNYLHIFFSRQPSPTKSQQKENTYLRATNVTGSSQPEEVSHNTCKFTQAAIVTTVARVEEDLLANRNMTDT